MMYWFLRSVVNERQSAECAIRWRMRVCVSRLQLCLMLECVCLCVCARVGNVLRNARIYVHLFAWMFVCNALCVQLYVCVCW
jgi:hypothetical protein